MKRIPDLAAITQKLTSSKTAQDFIVDKIEAVQSLTDFPISVHLSERRHIEWPNDDQQYELGVKFGFKGWRLEFTSKENGVVWIHIDSD